MFAKCYGIISEGPWVFFSNPFLDPQSVAAADSHQPVPGGQPEEKTSPPFHKKGIFSSYSGFRGPAVGCGILDAPPPPEFPRHVKARMGTEGSVWCWGGGVERQRHPVLPASQK